jgi:DNA uptake protein ComE-like DNA-binding protein
MRHPRSTTPFRSLATAALTTLALAACGGEGDHGAAADTTAAAAPAPAETTAAGTPSTPTPVDALLDPNTVTPEQLADVPGLDSATADALISGRPYRTMLGVDKVLAERLSEQARDSVYTRLWLPLDLNSASAEEIELIPGVGSRMRHEFEEYRPYRAIAQFRREIGKYVDEAEVARLERYVTIR